MLLSDQEIAALCQDQEMIKPFLTKQKAEGVISFGLSSFGYDIRVSDEFKIFTNVNSTFVDPKKFDPKSFVDIKTKVALIPPNSFALSRSLEYFKMPEDIFGMAVGKSTYARCGIVTNVTPLEPGWESPPCSLLLLSEGAPEPDVESLWKADGEVSWSGQRPRLDQRAKETYDDEHRYPRPAWPRHLHVR